MKGKATVGLETVQTWSKYRLESASILYNGEDTGYRMVIRRGKFAAIVGSRYYIIPNELAKEVADQAVRGTSFKPLKVFEERNRFYGIYVSDKEEAVLDGDRVKPGFSVVNSIDGSLSFGVTGFTYRSMCENGVILGMRRLAWTLHRHTSSVQDLLKDFKELLTDVMEGVSKVIRAYGTLSRRKLTYEIADRIAKSKISKKVLPDYIEVEKGTVKEYDEGVSLWKVYNDITEAVWHNAKTGAYSKQVQFQELHKALGVPY